MNILPHKSYHVYNLKNKEREREHRLTILRQRAKQRQAVTGENKDELPEETSNQNTDPIQNHINFWADLEKESLAVVSTNPEYEAEKRAKEKKWEKQFTMYLGDVVKEQRPWYTRVESEFEKQYKEEQINGSKDEGSVSIYDPLLIMKSKLDKKSKKKSKDVTREKRDRSYNRGKESNSESSSPSSIEKLRSERLAREKKERLRVQKLLNPGMAIDSEPAGRYHSQFNPNATKAAHELSEQSSSDRYNNRYRSRRYKPY
ncbi:18198_t:CDS:2 [Funneliformis geosporum]|uniref:18198_t:CDS:1 n=1 Tax=Funneliformis geosporum TaxID=1117311 RepID=A0A9W4SZ20_9GLOM|nr:18198_t:CDS:2 [Funneliformis geosporum]